MNWIKREMAASNKVCTCWKMSGISLIVNIKDKKKTLKGNDWGLSKMSNLATIVLGSDQ